MAIASGNQESGKILEHSCGIFKGNVQDEAPLRPYNDNSMPTGPGVPGPYKSTHILMD